ncbi:Uncharacterized protein SCG7109_BN_00030 [Chlamydiales bacterium SCGC AG-110-M15]|nr:Uncharacterized protein SCG7109_BN_00030 [Chlamydiales bacterium SCGC AG-110-M15]
MSASHFEGKDAIQHVVERQTHGIASLAETHGAEIPGHISSYADACREVAFLLLILGVICEKLFLSHDQILLILGVFSCGLLCWKIGRSAWHGWSRLERLHRLVEEERYEIENNREQERDELIALYGAKGFEGKLLDEVVDVLMADGDRLLRVMLEEEMGLKLECHEHPLKQGFGAGLGAFTAAIIILLALLFLPHPLTLLITSLTSIAFAAGLSASYEKNRVISAVIWNLGISCLAFGTTYFLLDFILS